MKLTPEQKETVVAKELRNEALTAINDYRNNICGISNKDVEALVRASNYYNSPDKHIEFK